MTTTSDEPKTTKEAAQTLGVSVATLRNWSDWFAVALSESARPGHKPERRFTGLDMVKLTYIKQLRSDGLQAEQIRQRLTETTFQENEIIATTNANKPQQTAIEPIQNAPETHSAAQLPMVALDDLRNEFNAKLAAVEQRTRPNVWWFAAGLVAGLGMAAVAELFALVARK